MKNTISIQFVLFIFLSQSKFSLVNSLLQQMVCSKLTAIFTRHGQNSLHSELYIIILVDYLKVTINCEY